ncbi:NUDIX domain-containing protein [Kribbella endophytica]
MEVGERPVDAAGREVGEELGIGAVFNDPERRPAFVTVTETVGAGRHVDVSLWFVLEGRRGMPVVDGSGEFASVRWWAAAELAGGEERFDPGFGRFCRKVGVGTGVRVLGEGEFIGIPQERHAELSAGVRRLER